jgi:hypothetical protein
VGGDDGGLVCCRAAVGQVMVVCPAPQPGPRIRGVFVVCVAHLHGASICIAWIRAIARPALPRIDAAGDFLLH